MPPWKVTAIIVSKAIVVSKETFIVHQQGRRTVMKFLKQHLLASCLCFAAFAPLVFAGDAVNINTANAETLTKILKGVGPDKASAIIAYRQQHGPFTSVDQLVEVKGIGKKLVDMNRDMIVVGEAAPDSR